MIMLQIVGPMANNLPQLYGDYESEIVFDFAQTPLEGLTPLAQDELKYAAGCTGDHSTQCQVRDLSTLSGA